MDPDWPETFFGKIHGFLMVFPMDFPIFRGFPYGFWYLSRPAAAFPRIAGNQGEPLQPPGRTRPGSTAAGAPRVEPRMPRNMEMQAAPIYIHPI